MRMHLPVSRSARRHRTTSSKRSTCTRSAKSTVDVDDLAKLTAACSTVQVLLKGVKTVEARDRIVIAQTEFALQQGYVTGGTRVLCIFHRICDVSTRTSKSLSR